MRSHKFQNSIRIEGDTLSADILQAGGLPVESGVRARRRKGDGRNSPYGLDDEPFAVTSGGFEIASDSERILFGQLVEQHQDYLFSFVLGMMGKYDDAQDLTAKAFLKAFVGFKKFRRNCSFKTWVTTVAINLVKNYWRDRKPISSMESMNEDVGFIPIEGDDGPEDTMISEENRERINRAVCQLPMKFRPFVVMRHMQDMSYEEIAEANDVPVTTVRNRIHQGKKLLEEILIGRGIAQKTEDGYELT